MSGESGGQKGTAAAGVFFWVLGLSILLGWIPILGPFLAGVVGGWKARRADMAFAGALLPALLWGTALIVISHRELSIGSQMVSAGPLFYLGPVTAAAILGGALIGVARRWAAVLGAAICALGVGHFARYAGDVYGVVQTLRANTQAAYVPEKNKTCPDNLKQLYNALQTYADSWDDTLPPADNWMTAIKDYVPKDEWLHCPEASHGDASKFGYSMNPDLAGKKRKEISDPKSIPLVYDSTDLTMNAHAAPTSLPAPGRHGGKNNVVYADGTVAQK